MRIDARPEFEQKPKPLTLPGDARVSDAVDAMSTRNYGSVVVEEPDGTIAGIVTERDLMRRVLNPRKDPDTTPIREVMTSDIRVAKASDDLIDWLRQMSNDRFRHLPVVDDQGRLIKMMSQGDFVSYTWPELIFQAREKAKATLIPNTQVGVIVAGVLAYALLVPVVFGLI
jgi:CBS domain-containing protein